MRLDKLEWTRKMLGEILVANYGKSLPKTKRIAGNINVYGSGGIVGSHNEYLVKGPGIIIGRKGTVGSINYVKDNYYPIDTVYYIQEGLDYDLKFLFYKLKTIGLDKMNTHSAVPGLNREHMYSKEVLMPKINEQKAIAKILSDLDEKIEVNNKINKNLEEMAQAIFKQWFVDFEFPNEEGKPYKSSGGEMVESELGMIPKGWNISELGELYEVKGGKRLPKGHSLQDTKTKYPYIRVTDVANGSIDKKSLKYISEETREKIDKYNINYSDLYISIAGTVGIVGMINKSLDNASLTENMAKIKVGNIDKYYLYLLLNSKQGQETILSKVVGSTQPKLPLYAIKSIKILKGDNRINKKFYDYVNSLFMTRENNLDINERLEKLRNTLLPKLMSGEIRVPLENSKN
ncbi:TPA: restriction endonuclease subunit S [Clostridium perfringens]|uniref:restriction endonuclease subunit S n=1 Tax=Clostridium perfringens TaxID=1502 RepID=UPI0018E48777|nr:restriction endonuclease subunit S [Clostridium perfringens]MBI6089770.1 restriction endonuclease subunit S [Clostridium perfringens]MDZ4955588.1 restriction endonuclease subunit S [Clostridium perfringens]MDZ5004912.1 restriction endonuclease subunit S [Clostridium perfringens]